MRILGQGVTVKEVPYRHLGYLASTGPIYGPLDRSGGIITMTAAVLLGAGVVMKLRSSEGTGRLRRAAKLAVGLCALIFVVGLVLTIQGHRPYKGVGYLHPGVVTSDNLRVLNLEIAKRRRSHLPVSFDIADYGDNLVLYIGDSVIDGWKRPLRVASEEGDNGTHYFGQSAGRDGVFDTDDDVRVLRYEYPPTRPPVAN